MCDRIILDALDAPAGSKDFCLVVEKLKNDLSAEIGVAGIHDKNMNYAAAQQIVFLVSKDATVVDSNAPYRFRVVILVSSKGPLFTIVVQKREYLGDEGARRLGLPRPGYCHFSLGASEVPGELSSILGKMECFLENRGYVPVKGEVLNKKIQGHVTQMDGVPATVFDILFSEEF